MYVDEPPKDGNIPDFNISKIDICPFRAYQRSFRLFHGNFSKGIHLRSRLLCFTQNDHTGQTGFKICPFLKWAQLLLFNVTYFLIFFLCGFIAEPAIHSHNLRAKKKCENDMCWLSDVYVLCAKRVWCGKWGKYVETFPEKLGNVRSLCCNIFTPLPLRTAHLGWVIAQNEELPEFY